MKTIDILIGNAKIDNALLQNLYKSKKIKFLSLNDNLMDNVDLVNIGKIKLSKFEDLIYELGGVQTSENIVVDGLNFSYSQMRDIIEIAKQNGCLISGRVFLKDDDEIDGLIFLEQGFHKIYLYKKGKLIRKEMKPLIATSNLGKIEIYSQIFKEIGKPCCSLRDLDIHIEVEENGKDEIENAMIKARAYHEATGLPVLCNDSGLVIEKFAPEDQPGVFVRRYGGQELTDEETIKIFSEKLKNVGGESDAYFNVGIVLCDKKGVYHSKLFKSYRFMQLPASKVVQKGLPLRSLDYNKEFKKYMSEMTIEEANASEGDCILAQKKFIEEIFGN